MAFTLAGLALLLLSAPSAAAEFAGLGDLPGGDFDSRAFGVSDDGQVVVGGSRVGTNFSSVRPFRWTQADGMVGLGAQPGNGYSAAQDTSANGMVVVGRSSNGGAFRWTEAGGIEGLGHLPGDDTPTSWAEDVSDGGSVIVGVANARADFVRGEAFRWAEATGMRRLGSIPGGPPLSWAYGVSGDGSIVVGTAYEDAYDAGRPYDNVAFIWDDENGMRNLQEVLIADFGLAASLEGWTLESAQAISANGRVIVGYGENPAGHTEAFRAIFVPEPASNSLLLAVTIVGLLARRYGIVRLAC